MKNNNIIYHDPEGYFRVEMDSYSRIFYYEKDSFLEMGYEHITHNNVWGICIGSPYASNREKYTYHWKYPERRPVTQEERKRIEDSIKEAVLNMGIAIQVNDEYFGFETKPSELSFWDKLKSYFNNYM